MSFRRNAVAALLASTLIAAPIVAQAAPVSHARTSAPLKGEQLRGGMLIPLIAAIAIIVGVILIARHKNNTPHSP